MTSFWKINTSLLPVKVHFFIFYGALGCALPFRTVFAKQLGISATAIGIIFLAIPFFKVLTNPLFGFLVDRFKAFRLTIAVLLASVAATHVTMVLIPPLGVPDPTGNIRVSASVDCPAARIVPDLHLHAAVVRSLLLADGARRHVSCDVRCGSEPPSPAFYVVGNEVCAGDVAIDVRLDLVVDDCTADVYVANDSVLLSTNSSDVLLRLADSLSGEAPPPHGRDCDVSCRNDVYVANGSHVSSTNASDALEKLAEGYPPGATSPKGRNCSYRSIFNVFPRRDKVQLFSNASGIGDVEPMNGSSPDVEESTVAGQRTYSLAGADLLGRGCPCQEWLECEVAACRLVEEDARPSDFVTGQFWALFLLITVSSSSFCAVSFLVDAVCYEMLGGDNRGRYGHQRLWGTLGWGVGSLLGGYLNELSSPGQPGVDYSLSFYVLAALSLSDLIPVSCLRVKEVRYSPRICGDVCALLARPDIAANVVVVCAAGVLSGLVWNYQFWFMEEIGSGQVLLGLSQLFECVAAELPCFVVSGWVIRKIGYANCNNLTFLCFGLRYLALAVMRDPWLTLPVGFFNGPCFGIFFAAMTMYGKTEAPPGTEATVQSLLAMSFEGVGAGAGSILGGIGFDTLGSRNTFYLSSVVSFVLLLVNVVLQFTVLRRKKAEDPVKTVPTVTSKV